MPKHRQGSNFPKIPKILASMGSDGARNFGEIWSLPMFSHPRLLKCRQARISPQFLKPEMRKHRQGSIFPKIPKILASMGSDGARNFGEIWSLPMFSHPRLLKCRQARISPKFLKPEMRKHRQGSNFPKIPKILASTGSDGERNFGEIWSLPMFSHPRLLQCCQARISPKFLKPEMRKHRQGSNFLKIPKLLASVGGARAIVAQILRILGEIWSLPMFSHFRLQEFWGNLIPADVFAS